MVTPWGFDEQRCLATLERGDVVLALVGDVLKVLLRRKTAVHQHKTKLQGVVNARFDHLAHPLVIGFRAAALDLPRLQITILVGLDRHLERHRYRVPLAVVVMLAHQIALKSVQAF